MPITALPTPPTTADPATFDTRADAFLSALPTFVTEANAAAAAVDADAAAADVSADAASASAATAATAAATAGNATAYSSASSSSHSFTAGSKAFVVEASKSFATDDQITAIRRDASDQRMRGLVTGVAGTTVTANFTDIDGAGGPYTSWLIVHTAIEAAPAVSAATAAEVRTGTNADKFVSADALMDAADFITLTDGATVNWNVQDGFNAKVILGGNRTIAAPTNMVDGVTYTLNVGQDGTGSRVPVLNAIFDFGAAGAPTFQTAANKWDKITGQYNDVTSKLECSFRKGA